jgi:hypothetical protein
LCDSVPILDRRQATNKQISGREMNPPTSTCNSTDSSSLDSLSFGDGTTQSLDRAFGGKLRESLTSNEAHRGCFFLRTASASM